MDLPDRHMLLGMALGAVCATVLAAIGPGFVVKAFGDEFAAPGFDPSQLVKFEGTNYIVQHEDWVDTTPLATTRVKKIEMGKVSYVDVTTTATGTYSTDAMFSNHIQYPGVSVEAAPWPHNRNRNRFSYWSNGGWSSFSSQPGNSWYYLNTGAISLAKLGEVICISTATISVC
ncbi:hypothetical protein [Devosia yakushimensis]|nr:hypothetical protein [Devosia yakushimensis]